MANPKSNLCLVFPNVLDLFVAKLYLFLSLFLRLKREAGCEIVIATATSGDCGTMDYRPEEIARLRHAEAVAGACDCIVISPLGRTTNSCGPVRPGVSSASIGFWSGPTMRRASGLDGNDTSSA